ncbi:hypothetical protein LSM04_005415 [Trypanosoma melophagium]|uniref:uncharacterized protein n=1 Tax=Trypanosoma melophagium TaxID=715481 RepID=UPI00351A5E55|nr:hypothetical protein LSM04_005415 [Trypanosoma melophagium]
MLLGREGINVPVIMKSSPHINMETLPTERNEPFTGNPNGIDENDNDGTHTLDDNPLEIENIVPSLES